MEPSSSKRWIVAAIVLAAVGVAAGAWLLDQFRQDAQPTLKFERLDEPPDEHFVLNGTTHDRLEPKVQDLLQRAIREGRSASTLAEEDLWATFDVLEEASRDQTGTILKTFRFDESFLRYGGTIP